MDLFVVVAFAGVGPVGDVHAAVGAHGQGDAAEPGVVGYEEVGAVLGDLAGAFALERVVVDAVAVDVAGEERAVVFLGQVVAEVDQRARVGVAAAGRVVLVALS